MKKAKRSSSTTCSGKEADQRRQVSRTVPPILANPFLHLVLVALAGIAVYGNTFGSPFVLDDVTSIFGNPLVRDFTFSFRPRIVGDLTFAMNFRLGGMDVAGYHLVNLAIHIITGGLVYLLISLLRQTPMAREKGVADEYRFIPLFTALLFMCHPVQTQAVTYISQRFASLAALFYVGTLLLWIGARNAQKGKRAVLYASAVLTALLAMATKEMAATLPVTILLLEWVFYGAGIRRLITSALTFFAAASLIPLAFFAAGSTGLLDQLRWMASPTDAISRGDYFLTELRVLATYLRLLILPVGQNFDYDYAVSHSVSPAVVGSFVLVGTLIIAAVYLVVKGRRAGDGDLKVAGFGILWFFVTISIESSVIPLQDVIFEHRLYLPSVGMFLSLVTLVMMARERWLSTAPAARVVVPAIGIMVFVLAVAAASRNQVWKDEITLWEDVVGKSPGKARAHGSLGGAYQKNGLLEAAAREYQAAITIDPRDAAGFNNLGAIYSLQKRWQDAEPMYRKAVALNRQNPKGRYNLGSALMELGRLSEAEAELLEAIRLKPDYGEAHNSLGIVYARTSRNGRAMAEFKEAMRLNPENKEAAGNWQALNTALDSLSSKRGR